MLKKCHSHRGFSLIELLVAIAIVGVLAAVAVPSYSNYIRRGEADAAYGDMQGLSLALEGRFRRVLSYPPTPATNNTEKVKELVTSWAPNAKAAAAFNFQYTLVNQAAASYRLSAVGQTTSNFKNCTLILDVTKGAATRYCNDPAVCQVKCEVPPAPPAN